MRKLASVQTISELAPIEGRDRIELATVLGWKVIVKKDEFKVGDNCVYVEIDSVMPEKPEFEFLRSKNFRIKTMKLAGVVSQGICFPMSILPNAEEMHLVGEDVTELLGVTKYDEYAGTEPVAVEEKSKKKYPNWLMRSKLFRSIVLPKKVSRAFPSFISKTDETRVQTIPEVLLNKEPMIVTEKVDCCSMTCVLTKTKKWYQFKPVYEFSVYSRNCYIGEDMNSFYWKAATKFDIEGFLKDIIGDGDWVAVQGEVLGEKIQGNPYKLKGYDFKVFNVISPNGRMSSVDGKELCEKHDVNFVPVLDTNFVLPDTVDELLTYATAKSVVNKDVLREGVVIRSQDGTKSFKAVSPEYLLKFNK